MTITSTYHLPPTTCHLPLATCHLPPATCHLSDATCHLPPAICYMPPATCHQPPAISHLSTSCHSPRGCRLPRETFPPRVGPRAIGGRWSAPSSRYSWRKAPEVVMHGEVLPGHIIPGGRPLRILFNMECSLDLESIRSQAQGPRDFHILRQSRSRVRCSHTRLTKQDRTGWIDGGMGRQLV